MRGSLFCYKWQRPKATVQERGVALSCWILVILLRVQQNRNKSCCRTVVIPQNEVWIVQRLLGLNPEGEFLLMEQGHRVRGRAICNQLKSLCRKSGVYVKTPHKARKTYGSILLDNHVDQRLITEQMGHTSIGTTEQHYHRNRRSLEKKQSVLSQIHDFSFKSSCKPEKSNQKGNQMLEK